MSSQQVVNVSQSIMEIGRTSLNYVTLLLLVNCLYVSFGLNRVTNKKEGAKNNNLNYEEIL